MTDTTSKKMSPSSRRFLTERELAKRWNISVRTLQKKRYAGGGCPFHKFDDGSVRYRLRDIRAYERSARRRSTSDSASVE